MFLDLHEGILEEFAAAQRPMSLRYEARVEARFARVRARRCAGDRERRAELRVRRVLQRRTWAPPRPRVVVVACARCGGPAEKREGYRGLVHRCVAGQAKEGAKG